MHITPYSKLLHFIAHGFSVYASNNFCFTCAGADVGSGTGKERRYQSLGGRSARLKSCCQQEWSYTSDQLRVGHIGACSGSQGPQSAGCCTSIQSWLRQHLLRRKIIPSNRTSQIRIPFTITFIVIKQTETFQTTRNQWWGKHWKSST